MRRTFPPALLLVAVLALASPVASLAAGQRAQPRVVGGSDATIAQYPWQAAVVISPAKAPGEDAHQRQFCGGSLITSRIVITAAHCVYHRDPDCNSDASCETGDPNGDGTRKADPDDIDVVLSRTTLSNPEEGEEVPVESVTYQDHYDPTFGSSGIPSVDVAYLVLTAPASEPTIQIAGSDEAGLWAPGSNVEISGWGSTSETGDTVDTLRAATVPMTSDATCAEEYGSNFDPDTMVCAGYQDGGVDTCYGDSGGPLEAPLGDGGYRLVGITSWGRGCAEPGYAGVYTRVAGAPMANLIQEDVDELAATYNLGTSEPIFGSGGVPRTSPPPPAVSTPTPPDAPATATPAPQPRSPYAKCSRAKTKKKRRHCMKHVRMRQNALT